MFEGDMLLPRVRRVRDDLIARAGELGQVAQGAVRGAATRLTYSGWTPSDLVVVAGSPRSGTTWLAETLDADGSFRYCFEPLERHHRAPVLRSLPDQPYACPGDDSSEIVGPMDRLLNGSLFSSYSDRWDPHPSLRRRERLLIKFTHGNLMLGWIQHRRPDVPIVLIVRHPLAVIASRTKLPGLDWSDDREALDDLLAQPDLVADHLGPFVPLIASVNDRFDQQMVLWCIEQMVPLRQQPGSRIHLVRYEDCLAQPHRVLPELFAHTNVQLTQRVFDGLARPSATSWNGSGFSDDAVHHTEKWRSEFTSSQVDRAHELMGIFGLGHLYPPDRIEPDRIEPDRIEPDRIEMSARFDDPVSELPPLAS